MNFIIRKADRGQAKPLVGIYGESGSGKTYSSLLLARGFVGPTGRIVMIETEAGRGEAFADMIPGGYEVLSMRGNFSPVEYGKAITAAEEAKADALIIDSGSHEWSGAGGVLSQAAERQDSGVKGVLAWQKPKLDHQRHFMLRLMQTPIPLVILNLRAKYPMIEKAKPGGGKEWVRSETLEPDQAGDILFELFVHGWLDHSHRFHGTKYTLPELADVIRDNEPISIDSGRRLADWARGGQPSRGTASSPAVNQPAPAEALQQTSGAGEVPMTELDAQLAEAAEHGMLRLEHVWTGLTGKQQSFLKAALDRRHKPRATEVDRAKEHADTE